MKNIAIHIFMLTGLVGMTSSAFAGQIFTWQDIKQEAVPSVSKPAMLGYLKIYTKDETVNDGGYLWQRGPRYMIFTGNGKRIENSQNEFGSPNTFTLSPGKYVIVPEDKQYKNEITGAILEPGKVTEVHLMGG